MKNNIDLSELYEQRLLLFIEDYPQSNEYRHLIFTKEQYKQISDTISSFTKISQEEDTETCEITASDAIYKLPDLQHHL